MGAELLATFITAVVIGLGLATGVWVAHLIPRGLTALHRLLKERKL